MDNDRRHEAPYSPPEVEEISLADRISALARSNGDGGMDPGGEI